MQQQDGGTAAAASAEGQQNNDNTNANAAQSHSRAKPFRNPTQHTSTHLTVDVGSAHTVGQGTARHTVYMLLVRWDADISWTLERRFSDFASLHAKLAAMSQLIPSLPKKTFLRSLDVAFVEKRRAQLAIFINQLIKIEFSLHSRELHRFLELDERLHLDTRYTQPQVIKEVEDERFGVNAVVYDEEAKTLITGCGDVYRLSRIDSKLSNFRFPWEKQGCIVPTGSFSVWQVNAKTLDWVCRATLYFDVQVTAIGWDPARRHITVGLEDGRVVVYASAVTVRDGHDGTTAVDDADEYGPNTPCMRKLQRVPGIGDSTVSNKKSGFMMGGGATPVPNQRHTERVSALLYDEKRDCMLSCARDKRIVAWDLAQEKVHCTGIVGKSWLSSLRLDHSTGYVVCGSYDQHVYVLDISTPSPQILASLGGHKGAVRCIDVQPGFRSIFSGGFDYQAGIWSYDSANPQRSRLSGFFSNGPPSKLKSVGYVGAPLKQVFTGHDSGTLAVWDVESGSLSYCVACAHAYAIIAVTWLEKPHVLLTASRDGCVRFWKLPEERRRSKLCVWSAKDAATFYRAEHKQLKQKREEMVRTVAAKAGNGSAAVSRRGPSRPKGKKDATAEDEKKYGSRTEVVQSVETNVKVVKPPTNMFGHDDNELAERGNSTKLKELLGDSDDESDRRGGLFD